MRPFPVGTPCFPGRRAVRRAPLRETLGRRLQAGHAPDDKNRWEVILVNRPSDVTLTPRSRAISQILSKVSSTIFQSAIHSTIKRGIAPEHRSNTQRHLECKEISHVPTQSFPYLSLPPHEGLEAHHSAHVDTARRREVSPAILWRPGTLNPRLF